MLNADANSVGLELSTAPKCSYVADITELKAKKKYTVGNTFGFRISKLWNSLLTDLKTTLLLNVFKNGIAKLPKI